MGGEPMNAATKRLTGRRYSSCGVSTCWSTPVAKDGDPLPSVIASTWSCVT
jgi:hypothetical protein